MATTSQNYSHGDYTIGWICALSKEQIAARAMLDDIHDDLPSPPNDLNAYTFGSIGKHNIVIACLPEGRPGNNAAATAAAYMVSAFPSLRFGLMVGIGGGVPSNKVRLGDVVVSTPDNTFPGVIQWDLGKVEQGGKIERTGSLNNPPTALLTSLAKLKSKRRMEGSQIPGHLSAMGEKWPRLVAKYTRSESLRDILFADDYTHTEGPAADELARGTQTWDTETDEEEEADVKDCKFCDLTQARSREPMATRIHYGLIASGNMVIKDAQFRNQLNERFSNKVLCVEMEAAGLMNDFPCLVIRGICDYADSHKNKTWQEYAAAVAAAFAKELLLVVPAYAVERMDTIISVLSRIKHGVELAVKYVKGEEDDKILEWLSPLDYGAAHSDILKRRQPETGQWLLESREFKDFIKTDKRVLSCTGIPGAGKTVMSATVIDYLHKYFSNDPSIGISYIYFNFRRNSQQTPDAVFLSLLRQIAQQQPALPESVRLLYKTHGKRNTRPSLEEILETFKNVVKLFSKVFVIVDALDECATIDHCREIIISEMVSCANTSNIKLFTTSRHIPEISDRFQSSLRLEIGATESDISRYISSRLSKLPLFSVIRQSSDDFQEEIKATICRSASGMFLLAQLHFDRLTDCITRKEVIRTLESLPTNSGYDSAYNAAMDRINKQGPNRSKLALCVLHWITLARRPLSVAELQHALGLEVGNEDYDEDNIPPAEVILSTTVGLVTIDLESDIIRLVHYTTQEFFDRTQNQWFSHAETYIAEACSFYLSLSAFENGCCKDVEAYKDRRKKFQFFKYAVQYWKHHVRASSFSQIHVDFLRKKSNIDAFLQLSQILEYSFNDDFENFKGYDLVPDLSDFTGLHMAAELGCNEIVKHLLTDIADPDVRDSSDRTPFYLAACGGHSAVMEMLLNHGQIDVNATSRVSKYTPLICAAQGNHLAAVELLVLKTNDVNIGLKCRSEKSALWYAAVSGHVEIFRLLLAMQNRDIAMTREMHSSALMGAVIMGEETIVKEILQDGCIDLNVQTTEQDSPFCWSQQGHGLFRNDNHWEYPIIKVTGSFDIDEDLKSNSVNEGYSPFHLAVRLNHAGIVELFLGMSELDVDLRSDDGDTALFMAIGIPDGKIFRLLLDSGRFDINSHDGRGKTPLMCSASAGDQSIVELLLEKDAISIEEIDHSGRTALHFAVDSDSQSTEIVKLLIDIGKANLNAKDSQGLTPLFNAARRGHEETVRLLLGTQQVDMNAKDERGRKLLYHAVVGGESMIQICVDMGEVDVNAKDRYGLTPLMLATNSPPYRPNVIQQLLEMDGIDLVAKDNHHKRTALMWAAHPKCDSDHDGILESFKILLRTTKFDVNERDAFGMTPFMLAAVNGNTPVLKFLLNTSGVNLHTRDHGYGRTAMTWAACAGSLDSFRALLQSGKFDINERDTLGLTPIMLAATSGSMEILECLLHTDDVDFHIKSRDGRTALMWAAYTGNWGPFRILFQSGKFDINEKDSRGLAPIMLAIESGSIEIVEFLLSADEVNFYTKDRSGRSAPDLAARHGERKILDLLLESGNYSFTENEIKSLKARIKIKNNVREKVKKDSEAATLPAAMHHSLPTAALFQYT